MGTIYLQVGQIWQEKDNRVLCPLMRINALDGSDKALCTRLTGDLNNHRAVGKPIRIGVKRLQAERGWKLVQEAF